MFSSGRSVVGRLMWLVMLWMVWGVCLGMFSMVMVLV